MFTPNLVGEIRSSTGRDVHARDTWGQWRRCPFGSVNLDALVKQTTVRSDSSASRGSADQILTEFADVMIVASVAPKVGDQFRFQDETYRIAGVHKRFSIFGALDHYQCRLEIDQ